MNKYKKIISKKLNKKTAELDKIYFQYYKNKNKKYKTKWYDILYS